MPTEAVDVRAVFDRALEISTQPERAAYLDQACADFPEIRKEVEDLLKAHSEAGSFLQFAAASLVTEHPSAPSRLIGTQVGPYKLLQQIGEGGMGVVYMAQQERPVQRTVALKIIKPGMDSNQVVARFEAERQALAIMDHPNIAKVLDAGTTDSGRPYFVMELVKGISIIQYADEHRLTPHQRLELFIPVCQAVQHAHQKGIIHRDIKPSNVLVAHYDDRPVPKVIDFGVAKAIGQHLTERTMFTQLGQIVGTIEYMSPEQARLNQLDIDTRTDIYSLGVLLYELLTGETPFDRQRLRSAAFDEILRIIREEEPPKPSTRLSSSQSLPSIAALRQLEPKRLTTLIAGDLDWIVMKALEKDRTRRYETANGFAMDVERYLADEPVLACPPSAAYRFRKFARRNRKPVAAAGLVLLTLLAGIAGTTWGLVQAERQRKLAEAKTQEAVGERDAKGVALKAEQQARANETKARQQAFAALKSMTADVVEKKFTQATVLTEDDRAFLRGIIAQYDAFAAIQEDDPDSRALRAEGRWRVAKMHQTLGERKEAENDYDEALSIQKQLVADFRPRSEFRRDLAFTHNNRGTLMRETGRLAEAENDYDQALDIQKQFVADFPSQPEPRYVLAMILSNRGNVLRQTGRFSEAEKDYDQALDMQKTTRGGFSLPRQVPRDTG
jgi:eukaryotic-like serine/threonine-protein kinase